MLSQITGNPPVEVVQTGHEEYPTAGTVACSMKSEREVRGNRQRALLIYQLLIAVKKQETGVDR